MSALAETMPSNDENDDKPIIPYKFGRPSKYTRKLLKQAREYLDDYVERGHVIPTIAGLSTVLHVRRETLHVWANEEGKEDFSNVYHEIMSMQEASLLGNGLTGAFNPAITKMALTKHGYTDSPTNTGTSVNVTINRDSVQVETQGQVLDVETGEVGEK